MNHQEYIDQTVTLAAENVKNGGNFNSHVGIEVIQKQSLAMHRCSITVKVDSVEDLSKGR